MLSLLWRDKFNVLTLESLISPFHPIQSTPQNHGDCSNRFGPGAVVGARYQPLLSAKRSPASARRQDCSVEYRGWLRWYCKLAHGPPRCGGSMRLLHANPGKQGICWMSRFHRLSSQTPPIPLRQACCGKQSTSSMTKPGHGALLRCSWIGLPGAWVFPQGSPNSLPS